MLLREALESAGFIVEEAEDGEHALDLLAVCTPHLIMIDVMMPGMDGFEVCASIRKIPEKSNIPIVMVTSNNDVASIQRAYDMGVTDFITKPIAWGNIAYRVNFILRATTAFSDLKLSEERLVNAKIAAEAATEAKSRFLANMSHEIRTPMNALLGLTEMVLRTELSRQQKDMLTIVHSSGTALLNLLNSILDYSKIEAGRLSLEQSPVNIKTLIATIIDMFCNQSESKGLLLRVELAPDIPHCLFGDSLRLTQILVNLVGNAIKFTAQGEIVLSVSVDAAAAQLENAVTLCFAVIDSGIGLTPEQLKIIFQPFAQADSSITRNFGGTGLGLSISQDLVRLMGGELEVKSTPGQGSRFAFSLPLSVPRQDEDFATAYASAESAVIQPSPEQTPAEPDGGSPELTAVTPDAQKYRSNLLTALCDLKPILHERELVPRELLQALHRLVSADLPGKLVARLIDQINSFEHERALRTLAELEAWKPANASL